jgi:hypothetical protein
VHSADPGGTARPAAGRSLVVVGGPVRISERQCGFAPLIAQLIANSLGLPQTLERRRASLAEARAAYGAFATNKSCEKPSPRSVA